MTATVLAIVLLACWASLGGGLASALVRRLREGASRELLLLAGLFVLALTVRLLCKTDGPGDLKLDQWEAALTFTGNPQYDHGLAPNVLYRLVFLVLPLGFATFVWGALLFGALATVMLAVAARAAGLSPIGALGAGLLLALHPLAIRYAGTANRQSMMLFLFAAALWALLRAVERGRKSDWLALFAAALLLVNTRLEALLWVGLLAGLAVVLAQRGSRRWLWAAVGLGAVAALRIVARLLVTEHYADWSQGVGAALSLHPFPALGDVVWANPDFSPWFLAVLAGLGLVVGATRQPRLVGWCAAALLAPPT